MSRKLVKGRTLKVYYDGSVDISFGQRVSKTSDNLLVSDNSSRIFFLNLSSNFKTKFGYNSSLSHRIKLLNK